jgi:Flp pilus assembly protein TadD
LHRASRALPSSFEIAMDLGDLAFRARDLEEAEEAFARAHAISPEDDRAAYNLATVLLARGRHSEAIEILRPLAEGREPHDAVVFNLAEAYRATGALESARDLLESLVSRRPSFEGASFALGLTLEGLGDLAGAERAYRSAVEQKSDDLASLLNLASVLERLGRVDEARGLLEKALAFPMESEKSEAIREAIRALSSATPETK